TYVVLQDRLQDQGQTLQDNAVLIAPQVPDQPLLTHPGLHGEAVLARDQQLFQPGSERGPLACGDGGRSLLLHGIPGIGRIKDGGGGKACHK
ncbi:MAG: hypothetical protein KKD01_14370, partial [Proteobacteria bacterium]|nr:hypothetical protein [Pseudomonadota bacterium]